MSEYNDLRMSGRLLQKLEVETGTSASSGRDWQRGGFVIEHGSPDRPQYAQFRLWSDRVSLLERFNLNDQVTVTFSVRSREYQGRWYTDLEAYNIEPEVVGQYPGGGYAQPGYGQPGMPPQGVPYYGQPGMPPQGSPYQQPVNPYPQQGYTQPVSPQPQPAYRPPQPATPPAPQGEQSASETMDDLPF